jgi:glutamate--cysteine ligase catalytic subunit
MHVLTLRCSIGLPSMNHLDPDRVKREDDYHRKQSTAAMATPLHPFAGPPHLHSNHQSSVASAVPASLGGLLSPPESRRTSGDEKESQRPTARQSLPSIHEALGSEQPLSYPAPVPPPSAPVSAPQHYHPSSAITSPSDPRQRTFSTDTHGSQGPTNPFSHPRSPYIGSAPSHVPPPPPPPQSHAESSHRPSFSSPRPPFSSNPQHNPKLPTLHPLKTTQSPPTSATRPNAPYTYPPSSNYEAAAPPPSGSMSHYVYPPYSSNYPLTAPPQSAPNSGYPPSTSTYSAPPRYPPPASWRDGSEMARLEEKKIGRSSLAPYGESVKRHLESFDLEASLNEVCTCITCGRYPANCPRWPTALDA